MQTQTRSYEVKSMEVLLLTGSTIEEGRLAKGGDKFTDEYAHRAGFRLWILNHYVPLRK